MLVLVIAGKSRTEHEPAARFFLVFETLVVSALEHFAYRIDDFNQQLAVPSSPVDHGSSHSGYFGMVDFVFGACACCLQQTRERLNVDLLIPSRLMR